MKAQSELKVTVHSHVSLVAIRNSVFFEIFCTIGNTLKYIEFLAIDQIIITYCTWKSTFMAGGYFMYCRQRYQINNIDHGME